MRDFLIYGERWRWFEIRCVSVVNWLGITIVPIIVRTSSDSTCIIQLVYTIVCIQMGADFIAIC